MSSNSKHLSGVSPGVQAYGITGFFYKVTEGTLTTTRCFQAIYTRRPDNRPDWFSFPLQLHVSPGVRQLTIDGSGF
jgi:hypothetical protein